MLQKHYQFLGGSICINTPVFFSRNYGLISVHSNDTITDLNISFPSSMKATDSFTADETLVGNLTLYNLDAEDIALALNDTVSQMKAAFIFHIQTKQVEVPRN